MEIATPVEHEEACEVVVLGAGLAGMTAAYELRDRRVVVLEQLNRVGGRTLSGGDTSAWYNLGAQMISHPRLVALTQELGLEVGSIKTSDFGYVVNGQFARGSSPERLLLNMKLAWHEKLDFAITALRMRRKLRAVQTSMGPAQRAEMDRKSLQQVIGRVSPMTLQILSDCCENGAGLPASRESGLFGLAYGLGAFLDPRPKEHYYVIRGGSQRMALAMAEHLPDGALRVSSPVQSVRQVEGGVAVSYRGSDGATRVLLADHCISAMPARSVLEVVDGLPPEHVSALRDLTPYSSLVSVAWPVADRQPAPWDSIFFCPLTGGEGFNLITNYGFLSKQRDPALGGFLNTLSAGAKADLFEAVDDEAILDRHYEDLAAIFPQTRSLIDRRAGVVQRWPRGGLPPMRPGVLHTRAIVRRSAGNIHFCGDYTSEPGLPGANGSGRAVARRVAEQLA